MVASWPSSSSITPRRLSRSCGVEPGFGDRPRLREQRARAASGRGRAPRGAGRRGGRRSAGSPSAVAPSGWTRGEPSQYSSHSASTGGARGVGDGGGASADRARRSGRAAKTWVHGATLRCDMGSIVRQSRRRGDARPREERRAEQQDRGEQEPLDRVAQVRSRRRASRARRAPAVPARPARGSSVTKNGRDRVGQPRGQRVGIEPQRRPQRHRVGSAARRRHAHRPRARASWRRATPGHGRARSGSGGVLRRAVAASPAAASRGPRALRSATRRRVRERRHRRGRPARRACTRPASRIWTRASKLPRSCHGGRPAAAARGRRSPRRDRRLISALDVRGVRGRFSC